MIEVRYYDSVTNGYVEGRLIESGEVDKFGPIERRLAWMEERAAADRVVIGALRKRIRILTIMWVISTVSVLEMAYTEHTQGQTTRQLLETSRELLQMVQKQGSIPL